MLFGIDHMTPWSTPRPPDLSPAVVTLSTYHSKPVALEGTVPIWSLLSAESMGAAAAAPAPTTGTGLSSDETVPASASICEIFCQSAPAFSERSFWFCTGLRYLTVAASSFTRQPALMGKKRYTWTAGSSSSSQMGVLSREEVMVLGSLPVVADRPPVLVDRRGPHRLGRRRVRVEDLGVVGVDRRRGLAEDLEVVGGLVAVPCRQILRLARHLDHVGILPLVPASCWLQPGPRAAPRQSRPRPAQPSSVPPPWAVDSSSRSTRRSSLPVGE